MSASHSVADLKQILCMQTSMSVDEQKLVYKGKSLAGRTLKKINCNVQYYFPLDLSNSITLGLIFVYETYRLNL